MSKKNFKRFTWFVVVFTVFVILWGAVVRSTGSGAGCGSHWPLCNGEIVPQLERVDTAIELFHRITSTLDGIFVILLVVFAYRIYGRTTSVFKWAVAALVFILVEGMLGRLLVVQEWVAGNVSVMRAIVVAIHLANTYILLLTLTITAWLANKGKEFKFSSMRKANILILLAIIISILFSAMGAITALGDTLFPPDSVSFSIHENINPTNNFLIRLRIIHPILAILSSGYIISIIRLFRNMELGEEVHKRGKWLLGVIIVQILAGGFTILTLAPIYMQITHLLLADTFWISLILFSLEVLTSPVRISSENHAKHA